MKRGAVVDWAEEWAKAMQEEMLAPIVQHSTQVMKRIYGTFKEEDSALDGWEIVNDGDGFFRFERKKDDCQASGKVCTHEWREYVGFTETYRYCVHCDAKLGFE